MSFDNSWKPKMSCCLAGLLSFCHAGLLPFCNAGMLSYWSVVMLSFCHAVYVKCLKCYSLGHAEQLLSSSMAKGHLPSL